VQGAAYARHQGAPAATPFGAAQQDWEIARWSVAARGDPARFCDPLVAAANLLPSHNAPLFALLQRCKHFEIGGDKKVKGLY
jgi:hypothetical protein